MLVLASSPRTPNRVTAIIHSFHHPGRLPVALLNTFQSMSFLLASTTHFWHYWGLTWLVT
ncbi:hypothetical protein BD324DRAFT_618049 [Kockovaella imperatae]|uniref:Uncharacterized protein n=1 Tax=Kockovaella imperatae TaxID=4999 RepID=A0A1Y1ULQ4_9TREE|nr:hypothetical protein BD324DRAFT_618049 [Kockovaella imperatae]ORX38971.1 hypothetical protein BD324DRAFT_618049 [Kockovaella imperatae]